MLGSLPTFQSRLLRWYLAHHRTLPWRIVGPNAHRQLDPYHVLVSEAMLQQTQVATVIPYFQRFIQRFPDVTTLAGADEQEVLRLWQGLGYYSRARNLQKAACEIIYKFNGIVPKSVEELLCLPGVGRYTAGAIASIAHNVPAPILDGNVARVLCRIDAMRGDPREKKLNIRLWDRAMKVLPPKRPGDFNSAMMELGAIVCLPREPRCAACPVRQHCHARAGGLQNRIPPVNKTPAKPLERRITLCIRDGQKWLIEKRPAKGRWAGMWQFITREAPPDFEKSLSSNSVEKLTSLKTSAPRPAGVVRHALTHRLYEFYVFVCQSNQTQRIAQNHSAWVTPKELDQYPLPRPHLKILSMISDL